MPIYHESAISLLCHLHKQADIWIFISPLCVLFVIANKWKRTFVLTSSYEKFLTHSVEWIKYQWKIHVFHSALFLSSTVAANNYICIYIYIEVLENLLGNISDNYGFSCKGTRIRDKKRQSKELYIYLLCLNSYQENLFMRHLCD